jgi:hypothetical protein
MENNCRIIHVAGPSASGKSSLGDRLKTIKNIIILDTDEIDDANCIKYLEKSPFSNKKEFKLLENGVKSDNKKDIDLFLNKNKEKNIIIIGHLHLGMDHIAKKITHKFCIKITEEQLFNQLNIRELNNIHRQYTEIIKLMNSNFSKYKIAILLLKKYKVRAGFYIPIEPLKNNIKREKDRAKKNKYLYKTTDEIYNDIIHILK